MMPNVASTVTTRANSTGEFRKLEGEPMPISELVNRHGLPNCKHATLPDRDHGKHYHK